MVRRRRRRRRLDGEPRQEDLDFRGEQRGNLRPGRLCPRKSCSWTSSGSSPGACTSRRRACKFCAPFLLASFVVLLVLSSSSSRRWMGSLRPIRRRRPIDSQQSSNARDKAAHTKQREAAEAYANGLATRSLGNRSRASPCARIGRRSCDGPQLTFGTKTWLIAWTAHVGRLAGARRRPAAPAVENGRTVVGGVCLRVPVRVGVFCVCARRNEFRAQIFACLLANQIVIVGGGAGINQVNEAAPPQVGRPTKGQAANPFGPVARQIVRRSNSICAQLHHESNWRPLTLLLHYERNAGRPLFEQIWVIVRLDAGLDALQLEGEAPKEALVGLVVELKLAAPTTSLRRLVRIWATGGRWRRSAATTRAQLASGANHRST